jgi:tRNA threonylcarbamoyladenosine biosynthesis protein TsaB
MALANPALAWRNAGRRTDGTGRCRRGGLKYAMLTILAIETSSELASCALLCGETVYSRDSAGVRTHSQSILPMVQGMLEEAGIKLGDCDAIAYGSGPGSFTGVRTACGIAQGLGFGAGLPLVPVVTLEAMALACQQQYGGGDILAVLDARMGEVYWAQYRMSEAANGGPALQTVLAPALSAPENVRPEGAVTACGNGLQAYAPAFAAQGFHAGSHADIMPHAIQVAQLARLGFAAGVKLAPAEAQPLYLRNKIAFTSAERQHMKDAQEAKLAAGTAP